MKRILICTGVLGGGTALVFAAAALAASIAPAGQLVPGNWQQGQMFPGIGAGVVRGFGGAVTLQNGPINNFGVVTTVAGNATTIAPAPAVDRAVPIPSTGSEAP